MRRKKECVKDFWSVMKELIEKNISIYFVSLKNEKNVSLLGLADK